LVAFGFPWLVRMSVLGNVRDRRVKGVVHEGTACMAVMSRVRVVEGDLSLS
jgi:hypothetical protein